MKGFRAYLYARNSYIMKYIRLKTKDPYYNLATEEYLLKSTDDDIFMLWQNSPSVIIGKNQNAYAEVNLSAAKERGVNVCRRITGGGAVYHDLGNVNYTFISSSKNAEPLDFESFTRPIIKALYNMGVDASLSGRNDIECNGLKISGNAQHSSNGRILHHGTLLFDTELGAMNELLKVDKEKLVYRAVKSCSSRVANLKQLTNACADAEDFIAKIGEYVCSDLDAVQCDPPSNNEIDLLAERNRTSEWIFSEKRYLTSYTVKRKKKYPFGLVDVEMELERNKIKSIVISGDFFGVEPIEELETFLTQKNVEQLDKIDPSRYIHGMSFEKLLELLR